jgi:hypothetical protein
MLRQSEGDYRRLEGKDKGRQPKARVNELWGIKVGQNPKQLLPVCVYFSLNGFAFALLPSLSGRSFCSQQGVPVCGRLLQGSLLAGAGGPGQLFLPDP